jgi:RHS repeat-associated protein
LAGRVTEVKTALGTAEAASEVRKAYTPNGQVDWVMDSEGNKTTYAYDRHDRLVTTYYPMSNPKGSGTSNASDYEQVTYESLAGGTRTSGLVVAFRNRANQTANFGYDALGRQISKDLPGSEPDVAYGYDLLGRLTSADQAGHALGFTYDALGRVLHQTGPLGTVASEWDIAGRRTRLTWPDAFYVTYDYLVTGETTAIRENGAASGIGVLATFAYDNLGRRTSLTLGNGAATYYQYDPVSRLGELKLELPGTTDDLTSTFAYNPASQIASNLRSNDAYSWTGHGSGTTSTTSNGLNQIASWVSTLGHDSKGNITSDGTYSYGYSSENLLTSLANSAPGAIQPTIDFAYDPLMRLAEIDSTNSGFDVAFGYDGQDFVFEGLSDNRTRRYVRGPGIDEPLVAYLITPGTGTSRLWYQADERGSITRISLDDGTPTGGIGKYDEYGVGGTGRLRYTGQYWLGEANLLYYRARIYDARLGRFLQPDPIGYGDGMNMYTYVKGDPVNFTDPSGLTSGGICFGGTCTDTLVGDWGRLFAPLSPSSGSGGRYSFNEVNLIDGSGTTETPDSTAPIGPPLPPDPCNAPLPDGSTVNKNVDKMKDIIKVLSNPLLAADGKYGGAMPPATAIWLDRIREGGIWDYKLKPGGSQQLGNLNYGATGILVFPLDILRRGAGAVQDPNSKGPGHWTDRAPSNYGDQRADIPAIQRGAAQCKGTR